MDAGDCCTHDVSRQRHARIYKYIYTHTRSRLSWIGIESSQSPIEPSMIGLSEYDPLFDDVEYPVESILTTDVSLFQPWPLSPCHATRPTPTFHGRRKLGNPINNRRLTVADCLPRVSRCTMGRVPFVVSHVSNPRRERFRARLS